MNRYLLLLLIPNILLAQTSPEQARSKCRAEINELVNQSNQLTAEYSRIQNDLRGGLFCSKCGLSKTELDKKEGFYVHLKNVQGNAVSATQAQMNDAHKRFLNKYNSLQDQINNKTKNCNDNYNNAINNINREKQEEANRQFKQQLQLQQQQEQERIAQLNQYTEAQTQKTIESIQNTPIQTFDAPKLEIKNIKKHSPSGMDKGSVAGIVQDEKIDIEFPELSTSDEKMQKRCAYLVTYRDNGLVNEYNKAFNKFILNQNTRNDLQKMKNELLNDNRWATSNAGLTTAVISKTIQTTCNLIGNLLQFHPAAGLTGKAIKKAEATWYKIKDALEMSENLNTLITEGAESAAFDMILSYGGPLGQAVKTAWDLSTDIAELTALPADMDKLKNEIKIALDRIDKEIERYNQVVLSSSARINEINEFKRGIDKYLSDYCKPANKQLIIMH